MQCFTIYELVTEGIQIREDGVQGVHAVVGDGGFPVAPAIAKEWYDKMKAEQELLDHPDSTEGMRTTARDILSKGWWLLQHAEVEMHQNRKALGASKPGRNILPQSLCLVVVETAAGEGGMLQYFARNREEELRPQNRGPRVFSRPATFPSPGVEVLAARGLARLLLMAPGSGFMMQRTGDLAGAPRELVVSYTEQGLVMNSRKKRRAA